jgi:hypothetical protein
MTHQIDLMHTFSFPESTTMLLLGLSLLITAPAGGKSRDETLVRFYQNGFSVAGGEAGSEMVLPFLFIPFNKGIISEMRAPRRLT